MAGLGHRIAACEAAEDTRFGGGRRHVSGGMGKMGREEEDKDEDKLDETYKRMCKIIMAISANGYS